MTTIHKAYRARLNAERREIRILTLHPGTPPSPIRCSLSVHSLSDLPTYDALSYAWGDANIRRGIVVDGEQLRVTRNLEVALWHLRDPNENRIMWIDALCINQSDVIERNEQVRIMRDVFSSARTVFLWIGEADDWSDVAFDHMSWHTGMPKEMGTRRHLLLFIYSLHFRPYFTRIWTLQEMCLAKRDPIVVCGYKAALWSSFVEAFEIMYNATFQEIPRSMVEHMDAELRGQSFLPIQRTKELRAMVQKYHGCTLDYLLYNTVAHDATVPQDKVYALVGLLVTDLMANLAVDYRKSKVRVYTDAMAYMFTEDCGAESLSTLWQGLGACGFPSWVPDFSCRELESADTGKMHSFLVPDAVLVHYSGPDVDPSLVKGQVLADNETLEAAAWLIDTVEDVLLFGDDLTACVSQLPEVEAHAARATNRACNNAAPREPLWRTLASNSKYDDPPAIAPIAHEHDYQKLLSSAPLVDGSDLLYGDYAQRLKRQLPGRTFFTTANGLLGLGTPNVRAGDHVTHWPDARTPFLIRTCEDHQGYCRLIGPAYVGGIMAGTMLKDIIAAKGLELTTLLIR
ncbi:hypothetical protein LTR85_002590 [Meristemomyces frigidus]|nr:hypothetical protein LTR85_002590 [Meristemomyces frigidus]